MYHKLEYIVIFCAIYTPVFGNILEVFFLVKAVLQLYSGWLAAGGERHNNRKGGLQRRNNQPTGSNFATNQSRGNHRRRRRRRSVRTYRCVRDSCGSFVRSFTSLRRRWSLDSFVVLFLPDGSSSFEGGQFDRWFIRACVDSKQASESCVGAFIQCAVTKEKRRTAGAVSEATAVNAQTTLKMSPVNAFMG